MSGIRSDRLAQAPLPAPVKKLLLDVAGEEGFVRRVIDRQVQKSQAP